VNWASKECLGRSGSIGWRMNRISIIEGGWSVLLISMIICKGGSCGSWLISWGWRWSTVSIISIVFSACWRDMKSRSIWGFIWSSCWGWWRVLGIDRDGGIGSIRSQLVSLIEWKLSILRNRGMCLWFVGWD